MRKQASQSLLFTTFILIRCRYHLQFSLLLPSLSLAGMRMQLVYPKIQPCCRWAVIGAMITTTVAVGLIIFGSSMDYSTCAPHNAYPPMRMSKSV